MNGLAWLVGLGALISLMALGRQGVQRFLPGSWTLAEGLFLGGSAALGLTSLLLLLLGLAGFYSAPALIVAASPPLLAGLWNALPTLRESGQCLAGLFRRGSAAERALSSLLLIFLLLSLLAVSAPATSIDALHYHLPAPRLFAETGRIVLYPWAWQAGQPLASELLMVPAFLLGQPQLAPFCLWGFLPLYLLGTFALARRFLVRRQALLVCALAGASPLALWQASSAYVELPLAVWALAWLLLAVRDDDNRADRRWILAGLFLGLSATTKMIGFYLWPCAVLFLLLPSGRGDSPGSRGRFIFGQLLIATALYLPWAWHIWAETGNPFYPMLHRFFQGQYVSAAMLEDIRRVSHEAYGAGQGGLALLLLPLRFLAQGELFDYGQLFGPWPVLILPLLPLLWKAGQTWRKLAAFCGLYLLIWFWGSQQARFLLPLAAPLALLGVAAGERLEGSLRILWRGSFALWLIASLLIAVVYCSQFVAVVGGWQSPQDYLLKKAPFQEDIQRINLLLQPGDKVYFVSRPAYYLTVPYGGGPRHLQAAFDPDRFDDVRQLHRALLAGGYTHIYRDCGDWSHAGALFDELQRRHLDLVFSSERRSADHRTLPGKFSLLRTNLFRIRPQEKP